MVNTMEYENVQTITSRDDGTCKSVFAGDMNLYNFARIFMGIFMNRKEQNIYSYIVIK
jgi:hypothetical protein